jgi:hypothetical protein
LRKTFHLKTLHTSQKPFLRLIETSPAELGNALLIALSPTVQEKIEEIISLKTLHATKKPIKRLYETTPGELKNTVLNGLSLTVQEKIEKTISLKNPGCYQETGHALI